MTNATAARQCRSLNVHPAHGRCPGIPVPAGIEATPTPYAQLQAGEIITFGSCTTEWVVLDHPGTGDGQIVAECIKGRGDTVGAVRALFADQTDVYRVEPRENTGPADAEPVDLADAVEQYRELTFAARRAYFDATLPTQTARDARNIAFENAAERIRATLPEELADLVRSEHDLLTVAYEEALSGGTRTEVLYRAGRAQGATDKVAAYLAAR